MRVYIIKMEGEHMSEFGYEQYLNEQIKKNEELRTKDIS